MTVDPSMLEAFVRSNLNVSAKRTMVVLELLKVKLINAKDLKKKTQGLRFSGFSRDGISQSDPRSGNLHRTK